MDIWRCVISCHEAYIYDIWGPLITQYRIEYITLLRYMRISSGYAYQWSTKEYHNVQVHVVSCDCTVLVYHHHDMILGIPSFMHHVTCLICQNILLSICSTNNNTIWAGFVDTTSVACMRLIGQMINNSISIWPVWCILCFDRMSCICTGHWLLIRTSDNTYEHKYDIIHLECNTWSSIVWSICSHIYMTVHPMHSD